MCRAECAAKLGAPPSRRAKWSFGLSVFALVGTFAGCLIPVIHFVVLPTALVAGPVALVLSLSELAAIRRGEAPIRGERAARQARTLALLHVGFVSALTVAAVLFKTAARP